MQRIWLVALGGLLHPKPWKNRNKQWQQLDQDHTAEVHDFNNCVGLAYLLNDTSDAFNLF